MKLNLIFKKYIKKSIQYAGAPETEFVRTAIRTHRRQGWPYCPPDEGDLLYFLAKSIGIKEALEVGFATGSTAAYILSGLDNGNLTSIDYAQDQFEREGVSLITSLNFKPRHNLIEGNSIIVLPDLYQSGNRYGLIFLDGWKTFDHLWVDIFYCAKMLQVGGYMVLDDAKMPAVRKCISILERYYQFEIINNYNLAGGWKQRLWHILTARNFYRPYIALRKVCEIGDTNAGRYYNFWRSF